MIAVDICERLAALARAGFPPRRALTELPSRVGYADDGIASAARRASLGYPIVRSLEPLAPTFGPAFPRFLRCFGSAAAAGADWARELDAVAASIRERSAQERAAKISGAGATLSARTIAALPFLMLPVAIKQLSDPAVALSAVLGIALGFVGYRWLVRIVPSAPVDDPGADLADELAASLSSGASLDQALREAASGREEMVPCVRKVDLGARWIDVVSDLSPGIGRALHDASTTGTPIVGSLRRSAAEIRREKAQAFERQVQRAPIRMVIPLVCCILPSFVLVAIVPLLRGLAPPA